MTRKNNNVEKKLTKKERNNQFLEMYRECKKTTDFEAIRVHKRVKYLQSEFQRRNNLLMPIGTIYKLLRTENAPVEMTTEEVIELNSE
jgi:hypothetical protein